MTHKTRKGIDSKCETSVGLNNATEVGGGDLSTPIRKIGLLHPSKLEWKRHEKR